MNTNATQVAFWEYGYFDERDLQTDFVDRAAQALNLSSDEKNQLSDQVGRCRQAARHRPPIFRTGDSRSDRGGQNIGAASTATQQESLVPASRTEIVQEAVVKSVTSSGIFISYRRMDEPGFAGRLYDRLVYKFGADRVFMDVDTLELGLDFVEEIDNALSHCVALVAVIGKHWLTAIDQSDGQRRLDNPEDFVRLEIERALQRNIRVIPILVDGASMPRGNDLPPSLRPLRRRNGREMSHARFGSDIMELISTLERILDAG